MSVSLAKVTRPLFARRQGLIGIDFGTRMIKFAQLKSSLGSWKLAAVHSVPVADSQGLTGSSIERGLMRESLTGMSRSACGFTGQRAVISLPTETAEPRTFELPHGNSSELARMLDQELDAPETSQSDFWEGRSSYGMQADLRRVYAVEVAESVLNRCTEDLSRVGLECEVIDLLPFALARAVDFVESARMSRPVAALDWGAGQPLLVLIEDGRPVFTRVLRDCGLSQALGRIQSQLGIDELECAQLLATCGIFSHSGASQHVAEIISRHLAVEVDRMVEAVHQTFDFLNRGRGEVTDRLWLFGGGGSIAGLDQALSERLAVETRAWELRDDQLARSMQSLPAQSVFGAAVGLSLLEVTE